VIKLPESVAHGIVAGRSRGFTPSVIEGNLGRVRTASEDDGGRPVAVPVMGRIAAGTPIEAIQTRSHTINMPPELLTAGEHFALEVRGDSMIEAGILDGDIALLKRMDAADTGDIVVALIDDEEATLKRFRRRGASIGVPAAMRPMTGTATGRPPSSSEAVRTRPRFPSITLGVKPRARPEEIPCAIDSGSLITSIARARLGRRRMKPRSSRAVISLWMPDLERRSSASFISSNEGGTPASLRRSWMNRKSSACLRVSIGASSSGTLASTQCLSRNKS
jgi:SOS regulatory protein LexA